jgi:hypothetical protein
MDMIVCMDDSSLRQTNDNDNNDDIHNFNVFNTFVTNFCATNRFTFRNVIGCISDDDDDKIEELRVC